MYSLFSPSRTPPGFMDTDIGFIFNAIPPRTPPPPVSWTRTSDLFLIRSLPGPLHLWFHGHGHRIYF